MKRFGKYLLVILLLIFTTLVILDIAYTQIYTRSVPRNKLQYLLKKETADYDVVFLGSSRVENTIHTKLFQKLSNLRTINLGVQGAGLNDNLLLLKLLLEKNQVKNLVLQIDNNVEGTLPSNISNAEAIPFIRNNKIIKAHEEKYLKDFEIQIYIPFYRYILNEPKIGFRELFMSIIGKHPKIPLQDGFSPKKGTMNNNAKYALPNKKPPKNNLILDEIIAICKKRNIKLFLFTAPYCKNLGNPEYIEYLKKYNPELIDLSRGFSDNLFYDCGHLNSEGANKLTSDLYTILENRLK